MKIIRILSMFTFVIISLFFIIHGQNQTRKAEEALQQIAQKEVLSSENIELILKQKRIAEQLAADALSAQNQIDILQQKLDNCLKN